jgi:DNA-binding response OmpR family regulator
VCCVLVIDDEQMVRDMLQHALSRVNFKVETADNASGGIAKFEKGIYDLVITDIRMAGGDGHSVVHHIRKSKWQSTPVIGVSGTPYLLQDSGFDDVLSKPFAIKTLIEKAITLTESRARN